MHNPPLLLLSTHKCDGIIFVKYYILAKRRKVCNGKNRDAEQIHFFITIYIILNNWIYI